jgi:hypothetical protein
LICEICHKTNAIVHLKVDSGNRTNVESRTIHLCEECAREYIRSASEQRQLLFWAGWRPGEEHANVVKQYKVDGTIHSNETRLIILSTNKEMSVMLSVRTDLIPLESRSQGDVFKIVGTPLELKLFETSIQDYP